MIQLSDHVKNKLKYRKSDSFSHSSDELNLSDHTNEDNESFVSPSPQHLYRKRSSTFTTSQVQVQNPPISEYVYVEKRNSFQPMHTPLRQGSCQECLHRQNLIHTGNQQLLRAYNENRRLNEELRSAISLNHQYQAENLKLKEHTMKLNSHLEEYKMNFNQLKQKFISERNNQPQKDNDFDQLRRLRHELHVYKQIVASKRQEEQKNIDYFSHRNWD